MTVSDPRWEPLLAPLAFVHVTVLPSGQDTTAFFLCTLCAAVFQGISSLRHHKCAKRMVKSSWAGCFPAHLKDTAYTSTVIAASTPPIPHKLAQGMAGNGLGTVREVLSNEFACTICGFVQSTTRLTRHFKAVCTPGNGTGHPALSSGDGSGTQGAYARLRRQLSARAQVFVKAGRLFLTDYSQPVPSSQANVLRPQLCLSPAAPRRITSAPSSPAQAGSRAGVALSPKALRVAEAVRVKNAMRADPAARRPDPGGMDKRFHRPANIHHSPWDNWCTTRLSEVYTGNYSVYESQLLLASSAGDFVAATLPFLKDETRVIEMIHNAATWTFTGAHALDLLTRRQVWSSLTQDDNSQAWKTMTHLLPASIDKYARHFWRFLTWWCNCYTAVAGEMWREILDGFDEGHGRASAGDRQRNCEELFVESVVSRILLGEDPYLDGSELPETTPFTPTFDSSNTLAVTAPIQDYFLHFSAASFTKKQDGIILGEPSRIQKHVNSVQWCMRVLFALTSILNKNKADYLNKCAGSPVMKLLTVIKSDMYNAGKNITNMPELVTDVPQASDGSNLVMVDGKAVDLASVGTAPPLLPNNIHTHAGFRTQARFHTHARILTHTHTAYTCTPSHAHTHPHTCTHQHAHSHNVHMHAFTRTHASTHTPHIFFACMTW